VNTLSDTVNMIVTGTNCLMTKVDVI